MGALVALSFSQLDVFPSLDVESLKPAIPSPEVQTEGELHLRCVFSCREGHSNGGVVYGQTTEAVNLQSATTIRDLPRISLNWSGDWISIVLDILPVP